MTGWLIDTAVVFFGALLIGGGALLTKELVDDGRRGFVFDPFGSLAAG